MVVFLLDTNVLFAAMVQAHAQHELVDRWLADIQRFATCGLTQIGVFRLLLIDASMHGHPLVPAEAHTVLADFTSDARHTFLGCPELSTAFVGKTSGHKASFDDYLVQIAQGGGCKVATLDRALVSRWSARAILVA